MHLPKRKIKTCKQSTCSWDGITQHTHIVVFNLNFRPGNSSVKCLHKTTKTLLMLIVCIQVFACIGLSVLFNQGVNKLYPLYLQVIPQGVAPTPCIPCCLVVTDRKLLTCHQDCQTSFFRSLGSVDICDVTAVSVEADKEYCVIVSGQLFNSSLH